MTFFCLIVVSFNLINSLNLIFTQNRYLCIHYISFLATIAECTYVSFYTITLTTELIQSPSPLLLSSSSYRKYKKLTFLSWQSGSQAFHFVRLAVQAQQSSVSVAGKYVNTLMCFQWFFFQPYL